MTWYKFGELLWYRKRGGGGKCLVLTLVVHGLSLKRYLHKELGFFHTLCFKITYLKSTMYYVLNPFCRLGIVIHACNPSTQKVQQKS